ncbi:NEAT domain-containing protein [Clostridium sp. D53t1_180928_C8]|uniref:NEAT domain-containing protein n=1 Tax=Clostridium sp. D53t1_180928_C8 TaxID=2787101 RepID=UPI0018AB0D56|nr:NEAT domain-containing protein [Clostridium sp. D53t1_180928_C8]
MLKKKLCTMLAAIMVTTTVLGSNIQTVGATVIDSEAVLTIGEKVENGTYEVDNKVLKANSESESSMKNYIERKSTIRVEDSKITVTIKFNEAGIDVIKEVHGATVDGEEIELIKNEDGSISFIVPSIDSKINIDVTYEVKAMNWVHRTTFDLVNDTSSIPTIDDSVNGETPEIPETPDNDNSNNNGNTGGEESAVLEDGTYMLNNSTYKVGTTQQSMARQFIEDKTVVTVKDGKIVMTLKYKGLGLTGIRNTNIKVNGIATNSIINEDKSVTFEVPTIDANVEVEMDINVEAMGFSEVQSIDFVNDIDSLIKVDDNESGSNGEQNKPDDESNSGSTGSEGSNNSGSNNGTTEEKGTKVYTGKNEVTHESETGLSMARKALEETLKVEDVNGKRYVTLTFTAMGSTMMKDHTVYVNGSKVDATKTLNGEVVSLSFAVGSLNDSIKISAFVSMMGGNVEFGVKVLKDTLTLVTDNTTNNGTTGGTTTGGSSNNESTSNGTTGNNTTTTEEEKVTKGKLYSIKNNVTHESETGRTMARKYLNSTSKVEEIEGKYYVTLTFTGAEFMQNHEIYVNGKKVTVTKTTNGDSTNIRFKVSSLNDTIKVKTYVVPMSREVEFGVELLKDTLTFIKEYTVDTLPQTGAATSSAAVAGLGLLLTSAGTVLTKKRK